MKKKIAMKKREGDQENTLHRLIVWPEEFYSDWIITCHMSHPGSTVQSQTKQEDLGKIFYLMYMYICTSSIRICYRVLKLHGKVQPPI